jgi:ubiquinone/menaquinone biosynthesis C-methylase UbiE
MTIQEAYNSWSSIYDTNQNKTRDLEAVALKHILKDKTFENILEIGCGTGKNTEWLHKKAKKLVGVDFSEDMLNKAKQKISSENVQFVRADIQEDWSFQDETFDLVTCSLVLEHIEQLHLVFKRIQSVLSQNGLLYIGELHPFKQYLGTKAQFETDAGTYELTCFTHHVSDFYKAASENGLECLNINEWFDNDDRGGVPRILTMVFKKK